jgi:hypothetical protein
VPTYTITPAPTPVPSYYSGKHGSPIPFYIPLPIPPRVSPILFKRNQVLFGFTDWFTPIIINPITQNDVIFIILIFIVILIILAGITHLMMFRKDDDDDDK